MEMHSLIIKPALALVLAAALAHAPQLICAEPADSGQSQQMVKETVTQAGLVVVLGCADADTLAELRFNDRCLVHALDRRPEQIDAARQNLIERGLYGPISLGLLRDTTLPYADNLVNLLVVLDDCGIPKDELQRVLVPGGRIKHRKDSSYALNDYVKPPPPEYDDWTHFLHAPDNNAVSADTVVDAPGSIQWMAGPRWQRSHEFQASVSSVVVADGRVFAIIDEGPLDSLRFPAEWKLVARDAYNGLLLWKCPIDNWVNYLRNFRSGPAHLPKRLVAVGDKVYVTLGLTAPVSILDAASGIELLKLPGTEQAEEISVLPDAICVVAGISELYTVALREDMKKNEEQSQRRIMVFDPSGKLLWRMDCEETNPVLPLSTTIRSGRLYFQDLKGVCALDLKTGKKLWQAPRLSIKNRLAFSSPVIVATDDILLCADRVAEAGATKPDLTPAEDKVVWGICTHTMPGFGLHYGNPCELMAYDAKDGKPLWSQPIESIYNSVCDVMVFGNVLYTNKGVFDLKTGKPITLPRGTNTGKIAGTHHRCYRNKAAGDNVFKGGAGIGTLNIKTGNGNEASWIRGSCQYGIVPANGMLYVPPHPCACAQKVKLNGFIAATPHRQAAPVPANRLEKGPAFADKLSEANNAKADDWPMHRAGIGRNSSVPTKISGALAKRWSATLPANATQPVVVGDLVFVAVPDAHSVYALDIKDGSVRWRFTADAAIDSSPTFHRGRVFFGSRDGWVYALRSSDGKLAWRMFVAPGERWIMVDGKLESSWPVNGSVLIQNDALYVAVGRNTFLDGGIRLCKMNPATGELMKEHMLTSFDPQTGVQSGNNAYCDMDGANIDLLSGDGRNVFMKHLCFSEDLVPLDQAIPHLIAIHGFLEEIRFDRSYWFLGTDVQSGWPAWFSAAREASFGRLLCFDDRNVFGYGRASITSSPRVPYEDNYRVFASPKIMKPTAGFRDLKKGQTKQPMAAPIPQIWTKADALIVRGMALSDNALAVAGATDQRKRSGDQTLTYEDTNAALASLRGELGVKLQLLDPASGAVTGETPLEALPTNDGLSVARGAVFISFKNKTVQCWTH